MFKNGHITSGGGRGKLAMFNGTAYAKGTAYNSHTTATGGVKFNQSGSGTKAITNKKDTKNNNNKDKNDFKESLDWIETLISRIERDIDRLDTKANSVYKTFTKRNKALASEFGMVTDEIEVQQAAYEKYIAKANSINLSSSYCLAIS